MSPRLPRWCRGSSDRGLLTPEEARLAAFVSVAEDLIVESDSGGHTDNRPLSALLPTLLALRDEIALAHSYQRPIRLGAAGGIGTPSAAAAAFALGASFIVTGSVNQGCVESGLDAAGRAMLAEAGLADVIMAPAADMFEMGVEVQVLRRGTMFGVRAKKLYELYRAYPSLDAIPEAERLKVERTMLRATCAEAWESTRAFWAERDPREVTRAEQDPKHLMALVFRSYLGQSSRWAIAGLPDRRADYQIWCGPAMGAFNRWARGSFLEDPTQRTVVQVARNLMGGCRRRHPRPAAALLRRPCTPFRFRFPSSAPGLSPREVFMTDSRPPIAVVGVSALFPGSSNADGFWKDILAGTDLISDVPATHWLPEDYYDADPSAQDKTYAKRGGFLGHVDFDALGWGVPPSIIPATDTSQLLALIVAEQVLRDATGPKFETADRSRTSVILGVTSAQELLATMVSRLQRPVWVKSLREHGLPESEVQALSQRIADHYEPWQESSFPGCSATWSPVASPTGSISAAPTA